MDINVRDTFQRIDRYGESHYNIALTIGRVLLGGFLLYKGIFFIQDTAYLQELLEGTTFDFVDFMIAHYVAFAHLVGGILILVGLATRIAIIFQLPILIAAVIFTASQQGFYSYHGFNATTELILAIVSLAACIFYLFYGPGKQSMDYYTLHHREKKGKGLID